MASRWCRLLGIRETFLVEHELVNGGSLGGLRRPPRRCAGLPGATAGSEPNARAVGRLGRDLRWRLHLDDLRQRECGSAQG